MLFDDISWKYLKKNTAEVCVFSLDTNHVHHFKSHCYRDFWDIYRSIVTFNNSFLSLSCVWSTFPFQKFHLVLLEWLNAIWSWFHFISAAGFIMFYKTRIDKKLNNFHLLSIVHLYYLSPWSGTSSNISFFNLKLFHVKRPKKSVKKETFRWCLKIITNFIG